MLSKKERKERQQLRDMLREEGILPPKKKPLNRRKFAEQVFAALDGDDRPDLFEIGQAVYNILPLRKDKKIVEKKISDQSLTALKIIWFAVLRKRFIQEVKDRGDTQYKLEELYENVYKQSFEL